MHSLETPFLAHFLAHPARFIAESAGVGEVPQGYRTSAGVADGMLGWVVAIAAHNDGDHIAACLGALSGQRDVAFDDGEILVFATSCSDDTPKIARESRQHCVLRVVQQSAVPGRDSLGARRRQAMAYARGLIRNDGLILALDADAIADPDWLSAMLACFADDRVDCVAGRVSHATHLDPSGIAALVAQYRALAVRIEDRLDPQAHDPAPRHGQECGANVGVRATMFDALHATPASEDAPTLIEAVARRDGRVRHANAPHVTVRYLPDPTERGLYLVPADVLDRTLTLRRAARTAFDQGHFAQWARQHGVDGCRSEAYFDTSWTAFQARNPELAFTPVPIADLPAQIAGLEHLLAQLAGHRPM
jgi:hypothetical protein